MNMMNATATLRRSVHAKQAGPLSFRMLDKSSIEKMLILQAVVNANLKPEQKPFIVCKTRRQFDQALNAPHYAIGVFSPDGRLVGQALMAVCCEGDADGHLTDTPAARLIAKKLDQFVVIQSVYVHPDFRQHGIMLKMLEALERKASQMGMKALVAEVADDNVPSKNGFWHQGFRLKGNGEDPADNTKLNYLLKPIQMRDARTLAFEA